MTTSTPGETSAIYQALKRALDAYAPISPATWAQFQSITRVRALKKGEALYAIGDLPTHYAWVFHGLLRGYVCDDKGNEYNKKFFDAGKFPGTMTALLTATPSKLGIDALEDSLIVEIDFAGFRALLMASEDLKIFQIHYLERNWLLDKDQREIDLIQLDASARYQQFLQEYPQLADRLPQYHIASHLGITPTQLSRIRKSADAS